jgi:hypothetical protein
MDHTP